MLIYSLARVFGVHVHVAGLKRFLNFVFPGELGGRGPGVTKSMGA
jgi:hypothetical protein